MIRPGLLAVLAITLAPLPGFAQFGGMGGMGGGTQRIEEERTVKVEVVGQTLSGILRISSVLVDAELGEYEISPGKIKVIRLSKVLDTAEEGQSPFPSKMQGTVITTSDKEISGVIKIPKHWKLEFDYGTLKLIPAKLKTITFTAEPETKLGNTPDAAAPGSPKGLGHGTPRDGADQPRYSGYDKSIIVTSPAGDKVTFVDLETKKSTSVRLSESKETPLHVSPIWGPNAAALMLRGPKITRIAASNGLSGTWHTQDLREPVKGEAVPIVGPGVVAYGLGRYIYAFSAAADRWDVIELPKGVHGVPIVRPDSVTVEVPGHIYTFGSKTGKWNDLDIRALIDTAAAKDEPEK